MSWIRRNIKILAPVTLVALAGVAYLAFGVLGVHTLFIDDTVDEDGPVFASGAAAPTDTLPQVETTVAPTTTVPAESTATDGPTATEAPVVTDAPTTTVAPEPQIVTLAEGTFIPRGRYSGEGQALVLNDGSEQRFLRFENFSTDNGPDLRVYLTVSDANGDSGAFDDDFVDLGVLKGNIGDQNYEIPPDVDLSVYDTVVVWCVRFSTPFTAADLV
jgi:hypothetical protein